MFDIHSHILPTVDDGSENIEESLEMAQLFIDNGTEYVMATPHYIENSNMASEYQVNMKRYEALVKILEEKGLDLKVYLGNEVYMSPDILSYIDKGLITTMNKSRYILIEFPMHDIPIYTDEILYSLKTRGYVPIIAQPERNIKIGEDPNILYEYIRNGCLAQVNIPSLEGRYGLGVKEVAKTLITHKMIHFIGSDAHSTGRRNPIIQRGLEELEKLVDEDSYQDLVLNNAINMVGDREILVPEPRKYKKKFRFKDLFKK